MSLRSLLRNTILGAGLAASAAGAQPSIDAIVNGATFQQNQLGSGGWASIKGQGLSPCTTLDSTLPTTVSCPDGHTIQVLANGTPLREYYLSPTQVNFLLPETPGTYNMSVVVDGIASKPVTVPVASSSIGIFNNYHLSATINQNNTVHWYNNPARPGEIVSVYATACGPTTSTETLQVGSQTITLEHTQPPTVTLAGQDATVLFAGKAPGYVGLCQFNIKLPTTTSDGSPLATGAYPLTLTLDNKTDTADVLISNDHATVGGNATLVQSRVAPVPLPGPLNGMLTNKNTGQNSTFITSAFYNFLSTADGAANNNMRLTIDGKEQYASLDRNKTLQELLAPQIITLPQLTDDKTAMFTIDLTRTVQDSRFPERDLWVPGQMPLVNRDFAFYSAELLPCSPDNSCTRLPDRWASIPIQLNLNLDQAPDGQAYLDGKLVNIKDGLKTIAERFQINGQRFYKVVDTFDPTQPGVELSWSAKLGADYGNDAWTTSSHVVRQHGIIELYNTAIPGTLATFLHESEHAAGFGHHSGSPNHYIYYNGGIETQQDLLNFKGVPTPGEQSTLDFLYQLPLGTDLTELPAKLKH